ncbi:MAG TPA: M48 family metallopeptidase [Methylomirabilota bacterium]|nr:M48 family metallopeptidase [Methylomirabilota bacterium]
MLGRWVATWREVAFVLTLAVLPFTAPPALGAEPPPDSTLATAPPVARDYLAEARAAFTPENRAYQRQRVTLAIVSPLVGIALGLLLLVTGVAQRLRDLANARATGRWPRVLVFFTLYSLVTTLLLLPLDWYAGFALEHRFALSTQTLGGWALDQAKAFAFQIVAIGVVPLLALAWWVVESHPKRWWLWLSIGTLPVATAAVLLQPLVFDPLFNKFTTLHDAALRTEILALGARALIPARDVYEVDMSTKTKKVNAYVSGFGASQRIVLWDTTLQKMQRDEILFVMGHEMGHYVLHHIWKGLAWIALGSFAVLWLTAWFTRALLGRFGDRWGVHSAGDLAAMPLVFAMLAWVNFLGAPIGNLISRDIEHEADVFALEITHDNDAGARSFLKLAEGNRSNPEPATWVKWVLLDHPPLGERIRFALEYRPWERGEKNRAYKGK